MKGKQRTLLIAGAVLILVLVLILNLDSDTFTRTQDRVEVSLSAEQIEAQREVIQESRETIQDFRSRGIEDPALYLSEYKILGRAHGLIGEVRNARGAYRDALEHVSTEEETVEIYMLLFDLEITYDNHEAGYDVLREAIERYPTHFVFWERLIDMERSFRGLEGDALEERIRESVEATNRETGSLTTYSRFLEDEGRYEEALQYLREAAAQMPEFEALYSEQISELEGKLERSQQ